MNKLVLYTYLLLCSTFHLLGQSFYLHNSSFEGEAADGTVPVGWFPCQPGTSPDILPGYWGVYQPANEGETYLGLTIDRKGNWESISQRLPRTLRAYECVYFSIDLAHSRTYRGFNRPIQLRVWGGRTKCLREQLLYESEVIRHTDWASYTVEFTLERPMNYLLLEAYVPEHPEGQPGNILIDNLSVFQKCPKAGLKVDPISDKVHP